MAENSFLSNCFPNNSEFDIGEPNTPPDQFVKTTPEVPIRNYEEFLSSNYDKLIFMKETNFDNLKVPAIVMFYEFERKGINETLKVHLKLAQELANEFVDVAFIISDDNMREKFDIRFSEKWIKDLYSYYNHLDLYAVDANGRKHEYKNDFDKEKLTYFLQKCKKNELFKTEIPSSNDEKLIKTVVASNFEQLVLNSGKDALIYFTAGFCDSKEMVKLEEVANALKDETHIEFFIMDAKKNYLPLEFITTNYPFIVYLQSEHKRNIIKFNCRRTVENILKFVETNSSQATKKVNSNETEEIK